MLSRIYASYRIPAWRISLRDGTSTFAFWCYTKSAQYASFRWNELMIWFKQHIDVTWPQFLLYIYYVFLLSYFTIRLILYIIILLLFFVFHFILFFFGPSSNFIDNKKKENALSIYWIKYTWFENLHIKCVFLFHKSPLPPSPSPPSSWFS